MLPFTIPFGVLVGILIGLGRLAADGEITAMRAAGVSSRKVIAPVLLFATLGTGVAAFATLRLAPYSVHSFTDIKNQLEATQLSADVTPRVFVENFPNTILYVGDVRSGVWHNIFVADVSPPEQRTSGMRDKAQGPMITVAEEAIAVPDLKNNRMQLTLRNYSTHEMGKDQMSRDTVAPCRPAGPRCLAALLDSAALRGHEHPPVDGLPARQTGLDRVPDRAASPLRPSGRLPDAGHGGNSAGHRHAQGRARRRLRHRDLRGLLLLLPGVCLPARHGAPEVAAGARGVVAAQCCLLRGRG